MLYVFVSHQISFERVLADGDLHADITYFKPYLFINGEPDNGKKTNKLSELRMDLYYYVISLVNMCIRLFWKLKQFQSHTYHHIFPDNMNL